MEITLPEALSITKGRLFDKYIEKYSAAEVGREGEHIVQQYLMQRGYTIRGINLRIQGVEVDIFARSNHDDRIHKEVCAGVCVDDSVQLGEHVLVEVKTRLCLDSDEKSVFPEIAVDKKKYKRYKKAAQYFENTFDEITSVRFDVISIQILSNNLAHVHHMIDAYNLDE